MALPIQTDLRIDEAFFLITKNFSHTLYLWAQSVDCYLCDLVDVLKVDGNQNGTYFWVDTRWNFSLRDEYEVFCTANDVLFQEHGVYVWNVSEIGCSPIGIQYPPVNQYEPLIFTLIGLLLSFIIWKYCEHVYENRTLVPFRRLDSVSSVVDNDLGSPTEINLLLTRNRPASHAILKRLKSLDAFRGIVIVMMIFVNYGGGTYWFFEHSSWNGVTVADLIFPWFAWIMGVGIAIKIKSELRNNVPRMNIFYKICRRSFILISLGIVLTNFRRNDINTMRFPGVLQRLGLTHFIVATIESCYMEPQTVQREERLVSVEDFRESWKQWLIISGLVIFHTLITFLLPVSECTGYLGPGGLHDHSSHVNCTGGAAGYIDRLIFSSQHLYQRPTCQHLYKCSVPYDPEGLLGVLTTALCVYFGVHAGRILQVFSRNKARIIRFTCWSVVTIGFAGLLSGFSKEGGWIPVNKNLWSLSYVLLCSGLAFTFLSVLQFVIDKKRYWNGSPFYQAGMNSIFLYVGHFICKRTLPWQWKPYYPNTHVEALLMDVFATLLWIVTAVLMHKNKIFISI